MFRQYFKQAIQILKENRLTSVISILGTALSIAMILVVILQFQIKLVGFRPESNRDGDSEWQGDRLAVGPPAVRGVCDKVYRSRFLEGL